MANPTSIDHLPSTLEATTTEGSVTLNRDREYSLGHNGVDTSGSASTGAIFIKLDSATVDADHSAESNKLVLTSNRVATIGPNVGTMYFKTGSGSPTFQVVPGPRQLGDF